jgi:hypothetical protein
MGQRKGRTKHVTGAKSAGAETSEARVAHVELTERVAHRHRITLLPKRDAERYFELISI